MVLKIFKFFRSNPLPLLTFLGLLTGIIAYFGFHERDLSHWIWFATLVIGGIPIVYKTIKGMFHGIFASDIVAMLAIITAFLLNQAFAGGVVVLMQSGGEAIEAYGLVRATSSLSALLARAPRSARRKRNGGLEEIAVKEVQVGDILIVRAGELIPVDGTITLGSAEIDESALTGEPLSHPKSIGDLLLSGSVDVNGAIEMRADKVSEESQYAKIVKLVKEAQEEKAPIQRLADKYAIIFTPLTLFMAGLGFLITRDTTTILAVLVVATPCPLILATPLAIISGINRAAEKGIIVKGGAPIEQIAGSKIVLFDKTGTITKGTPVVEQAVSMSEETPDRLLFYAAVLEQFSTHSIAKAIVSKVSESHQTLPLPVEFQEVPGFGVEGKINGDHYLVGSQFFIEKMVGKHDFNPLETAHAFYEQNKLLIFVFKNLKCLGFIILSDKLRHEVKALIKRLYSLGIKEVVMLTGDGQKNAEIVAKEAGIKEVKAQLLPLQKATLVQDYLRKYPVVTMVGDGINDAPALATATVGVAMGAHGTAISAEAADIVFLVDDVSKVADAIAIGKHTLFIAKESIFIGIGLSFLLMCVAAVGYMTPVVGALLQEIIDVVVILNALRVR